MVGVKTEQHFAIYKCNKYPEKVFINQQLTRGFYMMITKEDKSGIIEMLDAIRESGQMNMFETPRWLVDNGYIDSKIDALLLVMEWMKCEVDEHDLMNEGELL